MKDKINSALKQSGSDLDPNLLEAFIQVESGGRAFDQKTGKLIIQFEPKPFFERTGIQIENKVDVQSKEWLAFNHAFEINPVAAREATSIGLPQIMGFHWERLGYDSVNAMWEDFEHGLLNQICALIRFIESDKNLLRAFNQKDFHKIAWYYNGSGYAAQAHRLKITPYNIQLKEAYENISKQKRP